MNVETILAPGAGPVPGVGAKSALPVRRPRLALVLGSGGVKSVAALGVASVLEDEGIEPELIVGCSAGSIFGSLLACGHDARQSIELARSLWSRELTSRRRSRAWVDLARAAVGSRHRGFGEDFALRDDRLIIERLQQAFGERCIEDCAIALRIGATDASSGEAVLIERGPIRQALRASVALPFLFSPHAVDGRHLVDGSVSDPLPLQHARHARAVLGVGFPVPLPRSVNGPTRLATRITASLTNNLMQAHIQANAGARCMVLMPQLPRRVGLFETDAMPELIEAGRQAALAALPRLHAMLKATAEGSTEDALVEVKPARPSPMPSRAEPVWAQAWGERRERAA